jgi:hypothetical protein
MPWFTFGLDRAALDRISAIHGRLNTIEEKVDELMATLDDFITAMTAKMNAEDAPVDALKPFIADLFAQLKATVPAITPAQQTAMDAIAAHMDAERAKIAAAIVP